MTSPQPRFDILAMGEPMVEFNQAGGAGSREYLQGFGGDTSNFAIAAARQGAKVAYYTRLGDDIYGGMLRELWAREGVDASTVQADPDAFTGIYFVTHDARGHQFSFFRTGSAASRMQPQHLPLEAHPRSPRAAPFRHLVCDLSECGGHLLCGDRRTARAAGVRVAFDTNLRLRLWPKDRARAVMSDVIGLADICLPSYDDVVAITGLTDPDAIVDWCLGRGARTVALKLGGDGAIVADHNAAGQDLRRIRATPSTPPAPATRSAVPLSRG